jgi:predicted amidohydrolase YtcJ
MTGAHNQGDRGADALLSAIEAGKKDQLVPNSQQTFAVDHGLVLNPKTPEGNAWERMKNVNMIPSLGMPFLFDPPKIDPKDPQAAAKGKGFGFDTWSSLEQRGHMFGRERVYKMLPAKSMIRAGLKPVAESDRGVVPECCPLWNLEKMVSRKDDRLPGVWGPDERVTREEAILMYTNWAAYYTGDEKWLGTLEPGKLADVVVIDGDYLGVPEEKISDLGIAMTLVNGKIVYSSNKLSPVVP